MTRSRKWTLTIGRTFKKQKKQNHKAFHPLVHQTQHESLCWAADIGPKLLFRVFWPCKIFFPKVVNLCFAYSLAVMPVMFFNNSVLVSSFYFLLSERWREQPPDKDLCAVICVFFFSRSLFFPLIGCECLNCFATSANILFWGGGSLHEQPQRKISI